jgi:hypothetical protein
MNIADREGQRRGGVTRHASHPGHAAGPLQQSITGMLQPPHAVSNMLNAQRAAARRQAEHGQEGGDTMTIRN